MYESILFELRYMGIMGDIKKFESPVVNDDFEKIFKEKISELDGSEPLKDGEVRIMDTPPSSEEKSSPSAVETQEVCLKAEVDNAEEERVKFLLNRIPGILESVKDIISETLNNYGFKIPGKYKFGLFNNNGTFLWNPFSNDMFSLFRNGDDMYPGMSTVPCLNCEPSSLATIYPFEPGDAMHVISPESPENNYLLEYVECEIRITKGGFPPVGNSFYNLGENFETFQKIINHLFFSNNGGKAFRTLWDLFAINNLFGLNKWGKDKF